MKTDWSSDVEIVRTYGGPEIKLGGRTLSSMDDVSLLDNGGDADDDDINVWRKQTVDI